ncbi:hypothetical protein NB618_08250 [Vibrio antiquarius]|nr:hypothetical protein [Vibrio antiquarius]MCR9936440.1 hypothetical protein [Vibrio antiquarius]
MRSACCNFIVYGFSLAGYFSGVVSLVLKGSRQKCVFLAWLSESEARLLC